MAARAACQVSQGQQLCSSATAAAAPTQLARLVACQIRQGTRPASMAVPSARSGCHAAAATSLFTVAAGERHTRRSTHRCRSLSGDADSIAITGEGEGGIST